MQRNSSRLFWALRHSTFSNWIFQKKISSVRIMNVAVAFHQLCRCFRTMQAYCNPTYRHYHRLQTTQKQKERERERKKTQSRTEANQNTWHDIYEWYHWITRIKWRKRKNYSDFGCISFQVSVSSVFPFIISGI